MVKKMLRLIAVLTAIVIVVLAYVQCSWAESTWPMGSRASAVLNFPSHAVSSAGLERANRIATKSGASIYLLKTGRRDPLHKLDLYWLGAKPGQDGRSVPWLRFGRTGAIRSARAAGVSLTGSYAFPTVESCNRFTTAVHKSMDATVSTPCESMDLPRWRLAVADNPGNVIILLAFVLLSCAIVWAWSALRAQSQRIRLLSGMPAGRIALQDTGDLLAVYLPTLAGTWLVLVLAAVIAHRFSPSSLLVLTSTAGTLLGLTVILLVVCLLSSLLLHPRVSQISRRQGNLRLARYGSNVFRVACLVIALVAVPEVYGTAQPAIAQYESASRWAQIPSAVIIRDSELASSTVDTSKKVDPTFFEIYRRAAAKGQTAFSESEGKVLVESENGEGSMKSLGKYDDVILTDSRFFHLLGIKESNLVKTGTQGLAPVVINNLKAYSPILLRNKRDSLANHLYAWRGREPLSFLTDADGFTAQIGYCSHPLVIYMKNPMDLRVDETTIAKGSVIFTDPHSLSRIIQDVKAGPYVESTPRIADEALVHAQQESDLALAGLCAILVCLLAIIFCAWQSASTWAAERRRRIFLLATAGTPLPRILAGRLAWCLGIDIVLAVAVPIIDLSVVPILPAATSVAITLALVVLDVVIETGFSLSRTRAAFVSVVRREE